MVPTARKRHLVGLPRRAHARFGLEVEGRFDTVRVGELEVASRHDVPLALEPDFAAVDLGAALDHRVIVGAAQRQVGARGDAGDIVVHLECRRRQEAHVESQRKPAGRGRGRQGPARRSAAAPFDHAAAKVNPPLE